MLVAHPTILTRLQSEIVMAARGLTQTDGSQAMIATIDDRMLSQAALIALQLVTGETIWPGDKKLIIHQARRSVGPFEIQETL